MYRSWKKGYYQLASDGWQEGLLFNRTEQFIYGMSTLGLMTLKFPIRIYSFILMPNHIHLVLSGTGSGCVDAFDFFRRRTSTRLAKDGDTPLPDGYGFKLIPIKDEQEMRNHLLYVLRNAYEKGWCSPLTYPWSSGWLVFSTIATFIKGVLAGTLSARKKITLVGSETPIPDQWEFHPELGLLPRSFVDLGMIQRLFPHVKGFETRLIKDYEVYAQIAEDLGEAFSLSEEECRDIVTQLLNKHFGNRELHQLETSELYTLAAKMNTTYHVSPASIADTLHLNEKIVRQVLRSKEYGPRPVFQKD